jgi:tRNA A-37 threonylcarbamoyl transferase component Bud32/tetratricopeptide (TPR) repeat protein
MGCPSTDQLQAFLDDQLSESALARIGKHVDGCATCQAGLDDIASGHAHSVDVRDQSGIDRVLDVADQLAIDALIDRMQNREDVTLVSADIVAEAGSSDAMQLPRQIGEYQLLEMIGEGASGRLYRALDLQLDRVVAVKVLKPELAAISSARARFEREARACAALRHDNIIAVYQVDPGNESVPPYLVMELIAGGSFKDRINATGIPVLTWTVERIRQAALALQTAHDAGIVHRDIKPSNLLLDETTERLRVADFGLARLVESDESLTAEGMIAGTPAYMSPEQIINPASVSGASDIYSLGVVLYEAISGELPFRGTVRMVLNQVLHEDPVPPRRLNDHIPRDIENVCLKAMAREQSLRYQTAGAFAEDLQRWLDGRPVQARPVGMLRKLARWCRRKPGTAGVAAIVATVLIAGAVDWKDYDTTRELERRQAEAYRVASQEQAMVAAKQRDLALRTVQSLVFEVQNQLESQPGMESLREDLLEVAVKGLKEISNDKDRGPAADIATVVAQNQLGEIYVELGRHDEARDIFEQAAVGARRLISSEFQNVAAKQALSWSLINLANRNFSSGETALAATRYLEALELCQQVMQSVSDEDGDENLKSKVARDCCVALQRLGALEESQGKFDQAAMRYMTAQEYLNEQLARTPDAPELNRDLGVLYLKLAQIGTKTGRGEPGELFRQAHNKFQQVAVSTPADPAALRNVVLSFAELGSWLLQHGDLKEAAQLALEESRLLERLCKEHADDFQLKRRLAACLLRQGTIEAKSDNWVSAATPLRKAHSLLSVIVESPVGQLRDRVLLAETDLLLASCSIATNEINAGIAALNDMQENLGSLSKLASQDSSVDRLKEIGQLQEQCDRMLRSATE